MKKFVLTLLVFAFPIIFSSAAEIVEINGIFYELKPVKVGTASVNSDPKTVGYRLYIGDVKIPSTIEYDGNSYKVTEINRYAFMGCRELTSVELPEGLTTIGFGAFDGCTALKTVNIPSTVTKIEQWGFRDCSALTGVYIDDIAAWCNIAFEDYGNPLYYAQHLYVNGQEITKLEIPNSVTTIGNRAFNGFASLESVNFGDGVKSIGDYAFGWCTSLKSVSIPDNVEEIGGYTFTECTNLASLRLSVNMKTIPSRSFYKCSSLESVNIPRGVSEVNTNAFAECTHLKKLYLAESVERIGASAFGNCENITDVYCYATNPPTPNTMWYNTLSNYFWQSYIEYSTLHVPEESIEAYKSAFAWSDFGTIIAITSDDTSVRTNAKVDNVIEKYYSLDGKQIVNPRKGINIFKLGNGQIKKIYLR